MLAAPPSSVVVKQEGFGTSFLEGYGLGPFGFSYDHPSAPGVQSPPLVTGEVLGWAAGSPRAGSPALALPQRSSGFLGAGLDGSLDPPAHALGSLDPPSALETHPLLLPLGLPSLPPVNTGAAAPAWAGAYVPGPGALADPPPGAGMVPLSALAGAPSGPPVGCPVIGASSAAAAALQLFVPVPTLDTLRVQLVNSESPRSAVHSPRSNHSNASTPSASSSAVSALFDPRGGVPRVGSAPNLITAVPSTHEASSGHSAMARPAGRGVPRSRSTSDLADLSTRYAVPHGKYLTPPHLRKGKGGRQPARDPRLDPGVDPKKARRILANRLSAAKSKLKQKSQTQAVRQRMEMLRLQQEQLTGELQEYVQACAAQEQERALLLEQVKALERQHEALLGHAGAAATPGTGAGGLALQALPEERELEEGGGADMGLGLAPDTAAAILAAPIRQEPSDFLAVA